AEEFKEFYSLFLSKPFGASNQHRWNNLFMFEENGGKWNRLDAEFAINDDLEATVEYNKYFGDVNTQFGQLEKSSNVQVGFNYSF
ncbi:MAG: RNA polymerase-associated protein rapA, partial [Candidatus Thioglobus sp.]|nr:RNA polymerase-associated protein rapA [Candidatus Thioglobus sp.]